MLLDNLLSHSTSLWHKIITYKDKEFTVPEDKGDVQYEGTEEEGKLVTTVCV